MTRSKIGVNGAIVVILAAIVVAVFASIILPVNITPAGKQVQNVSGVGQWCVLSAKMCCDKPILHPAIHLVIAHPIHTPQSMNSAPSVMQRKLIRNIIPFVFLLILESSLGL